MDTYISGAPLQNTYKEFTYTIPAGGRITEYYAFEFFRVLNQNTSGLVVIFGGNPDKTPFSGTGIGYKLPQAADRITLINTAAVPLTITIALGMGDIFDDRINFAAGAGIPTEAIIPTTLATAQVNVSTAATLVSAGNPLKKYVTIQPLAAPIYVGNAGVTAATGFLVPAGASYSFENTAPIYAITASGSTTVYVFEGKQ